MEEQFILRVPPVVAERIERLLNDLSSSSEDENLDMEFSGVEMVEPEEYGDEQARNVSKEVASVPAKPDVPEAETVGGELDGSDYDESDDSM